MKVFGLKMETERVNCPICKGKFFNLIHSQRCNHLLGSSVYIEVSQCKDCEFVFNSIRPKWRAMLELYSSSTNASGQVFREISPSSYYPKLHRKRVNFFSSVCNIPAHVNILDVGCGNGDFLHALRGTLTSANLMGIDPSKRAVLNCTNRGLKVSEGFLKESNHFDLNFDVISMISVLEHVYEPLDLLKRCYNNLNENGLIFIEVPNALKPEISLSGFFNLEHVLHFTPNSLKQILLSEGFPYFCLDTSEDHIIRLVAGKSKKIIKTVDHDLSSFAENNVRKILENYCLKQSEFTTDLKVKLKKLIDNWKRQKKTIAIYGTGVHTVMLNSLIDLKQFTDYFIDGDVSKQGLKFLDKEILPPEAIIELNIEAVLISSQRFAQEMKQRLRKVAGKKLEVATCYE